jgi:hypothetical protein
VRKAGLTCWTATLEKSTTEAALPVALNSACMPGRAARIAVAAPTTLRLKACRGRERRG